MFGLAPDETRRSKAAVNAPLLQALRETARGKAAAAAFGRPAKFCHKSRMTMTMRMTVFAFRKMQNGLAKLEP